MPKRGTPDPPPDRCPLAVVTGGSRGIGSALVGRLARAGARFTFLGSKQAAAAVTKEFVADGRFVDAAQVDARSVAAPSRDIFYPEKGPRP
jgi:NAD(P)-dependent dehydrogenase (short-subunit alcohol dehydrogenase family)